MALALAALGHHAVDFHRLDSSWWRYSYEQKFTNIQSISYRLCSSNLDIYFFYQVYTILVGGLVAIWIIFPYIGKNHPNWRSYFSEGWPNHQPLLYIYIYLPGIYYSILPAGSKGLSDLDRRRTDPETRWKNSSRPAPGGGHHSNVTMAIWGL